MELETISSNEKSKELKKHVAAIHCSNNLSLMQRKVANVLLYNAYKNLLTHEEHLITIPDLCKILGYNSHNYDALKDALRTLLSTVIEWNLIDDQRDCWTASSVLASVQIEGTECRYAYSHHMRQMLHSPSVYGRISLSIQSRFKSSYGLALYENCSRFKNIPQTPWFELEDFRKLMGILPGEYEIFRDLNRRVIEKAVDEVNCYSDIFVTPELKRVSRRVVAIQFKIAPRDKKPRLGLVDKGTVNDEQKIKEIDSLVHRLNKDFGVAHQAAKDIVLQHAHEPEYIDRKIMEVLSSDFFKRGKINSMASFIMSAIKNDYLPSKSSDEEAIALKEIENNKLIQERLIIKNQEKLLKDYNKHINEDFLKTVNEINIDEMNILINDLFDSFKESNVIMFKMANEWYKRDGLESKLFLGCLKDHMQKIGRYAIPCSYEEYLSQKQAESLSTPC